MKNADKKDKNIAEVFERAAQGEMPPPSVTYAAREELARRADEMFEEAAGRQAGVPGGAFGRVRGSRAFAARSAGECGDTPAAGRPSVPSGGALTARRIKIVSLIAAAIVVLAAAIALIVLLPAGKDGGYTGTLASQPVDLECRSAEEDVAQFIPFLPEDALSSVDEYYLPEDGSPLMWQADYSDGVPITLYVEAEDFSLPELDVFESLPQKFTLDGLEFSYGISPEGGLLMYFNENGLDYNFFVCSSDEEELRAIAARIVPCF